MRLTAAQVDRACGLLLGTATGDALGAGYEFDSAPYDGRPEMIGGGLGGFEPGEWTDDTAQAIAVARVASTGADLRTDDALDEVARGFADWFAAGPPDVGIQTAQVLRLAGPTPSAEQMAEAARRVHEQSGRSAGNGSLMRTAPVVLAHLDDPSALVEAALRVSALTHHDQIAGEGAALWSLMMRHAVLTGELPDASRSVDELETHLDRAGAADWRALLAEAAECTPGTFVRNGWVVGAMQAAWSAILSTQVPARVPCLHLQHALATAIGIGHDTDTVAAIAGALLGARWGASAVPQQWQASLHGWGVDGRGGAAALVSMATLAVHGGKAPDGSGWPLCERIDYLGHGGEDTFVPHPLVEGIWIGGAVALGSLPREVDAVISLCRVGTAQVPDHVASHAVRLLDTVAEDNTNLEFVIDDAARTALRLRDEGKRVFLHCVASHSRTPTVAAWLGVLAGHPFESSLDAVVQALPAARPQGFFVDALRRMAASRVHCRAR